MTSQLRFPEFTDEWQLLKFDDLFVFSTGKSIKQDEASPSLKTPCVRYGELYHMYSEIINEVVNYTDLPRTELTFSNGDEILLPSAGEDPLDIGSASALTLKDVAIGRTINVLRPKKNGVYHQIFVAYYINSISKITISKLAKGNSISNVYNSDLKKLEIRLPPYEEQQKIAEFLTAVDDKISALEQKVEKLETYKRGMMQKIFSQQIRFTRDDGSRYPEWGTERLGGAFEEVIAKVGNAKVETYSITAGRGFVSQIEKFGRDISGAQNARYTLLRESEFAYNKGNSKSYIYGCVYANNLGKPIAVPNVFISFRPQNRNILTGFYEQLFINHYLDRHLRRAISSGARMDGLLNVSKNDFFDIRIPVPDTEEQQKIADLLSAFDQKITLTRDKLEKTKEFKKGLLQRMFV